MYFSTGDYKEYFERLKALIEDIYNENEKEKVVIMTHSLGGPISLVFLHQQSQEWKDQYIKSEISLGSSWAGAVKAMDSYIHGTNHKIFKQYKHMVSHLI